MKEEERVSEGHLRQTAAGKNVGMCDIGPWLDGSLWDVAVGHEDGRAFWYLDVSYFSFCYC